VDSLHIHARLITPWADPAPLFVFQYSAKRDASGHYQLDRLPHRDVHPFMMMVGSYDDAGQAQRGRPMKLPRGRTPTLACGVPGKYFVVVIWDSQTGDFNQHRPAVEKFAQTYASDSRVALVSINTDPQFSGSDGIRVRPSRMQGASWIQGYQSTADTSN